MSKLKLIDTQYPETSFTIDLDTEDCYVIGDLKLDDQKELMRMATVRPWATLEDQFKDITFFWNSFIDENAWLVIVGKTAEDAKIAEEFVSNLRAKVIVVVPTESGFADKFYNFTRQVTYYSTLKSHSEKILISADDGTKNINYLDPEGCYFTLDDNNYYSNRKTIKISFNSLAGKPLNLKKKINKLGLL